jgi:hypothetical protein
LRVLVVGYGKIGRIKSKLWRSLGAEVFVTDTNTIKQKQSTSDGFSTLDPAEKYQFTVIDISTPANTHYAVLHWCLKQPGITFKYVLVEKPLASSKKELKSFSKLLNSHPLLRTQILLNESYYSSTALQRVLQLIRLDGENITNVEIELSKNRLPDHDEGRFFDNQLGALGIEVPHAVAMLDTLGFDAASLQELESKLYIDNLRQENQAVVLSGVVSDTEIIIKSYLGDFREQTPIARSVDVIRTLAITTRSQAYFIEFDPVPGSPRHYSKLTHHKQDGTVCEELMPDNHLEAHMKNVIHSESYRSIVDITKAMQSSDLLNCLRGQSEVQSITPVDKHAQYISFDKEMLYGAGI